VEPAEDCGISIVLYGTRMQLDLDVTELVDGEEEVVRRCSARRAECSHLLARHPL
jgi:hypothetical protein